MEQCRKILQQGLAEMGLGYQPGQLDMLLDFLVLMNKWNKAYNLTAIRDVEQMATLHILDSLAVLPYVSGPRVADIGTGAGLPGIPLAVLSADTEFVLVDSNSKKTRFVQQAVLELKLDNVRVVHSRVEDFQPEQLFSTVMMRAFADMKTIMRLTRHLLAENGRLLAMKGVSPVQELQEIEENGQVIPLSVPGIEAERCLICIEGSPNG